jgi:hypothetical protein
MESVVMGNSPAVKCQAAPKRAVRAYNEANAQSDATTHVVANPSGLNFEPVGPKDKLLTALTRDQKSDSAANIGEHFAISVISQTKEELTSMAQNLPGEVGETFVNCLIEAQESLEMRLKLVNAAFARLCVVAEQYEEPPLSTSKT